MESYTEYAVRCKTCNNLIAPLVNRYQQYLQDGLDIESALNVINLRRYCCRITMMSPVTVFFNLQNQSVVEGLEKVETAYARDQNTYWDRNQRSLNPISTLTFVERNQQQSVPVIKGVTAQIDDIGEIKPVEVDNPFVQKFSLPTEPGINTINTNPLLDKRTRQVGDNYSVEVLNGVTFLAQ